MQQPKKTNYLVSTYSEGAISISLDFIKAIILANDHLLKSTGKSQKQQARELQQRGLRIVENTYYALKRGAYKQISTFFLSILCSYWETSMIDMYNVGLCIERGEVPDLSRYGIAIANRM